MLDFQGLCSMELDNQRACFVTTVEDKKNYTDAGLQTVANFILVTFIYFTGICNGK